jgi:DNA-binding NtrC family response regulator
LKYILTATTSTDAISTVKGAFEKTYQVINTSSLEECLAAFSSRRPEYTLIDISFLKDTGGAYKKNLRRFWDVYPSAHIIVMAAQDEIRDAVSAVKGGASNYITYPIDSVELKFILENTSDTMIMESELGFLRERFWQSNTEKILRTNSKTMRSVYESAMRVAQTDAGVLITGETGTGKTLLAKIIHSHSKRANLPFISVHCGAIPDTLIESELFGHEKGAFTGAVKRKLGRFEIAAGGTVFLDEIGTVTHQTQIKLLQVLQDGTFTRIGGETNITSSARVISATNEDLLELSKKGDFRSDLYYRLSVFPIRIPALRDRKEDIPLLVDIFLTKLSERYVREVQGLHPLVEEAFMEYDWPGNIRELENIIERAFIIEPSDMLTPASFPQELFGYCKVRHDDMIDISRPLAEVRRKNTERVEKKYLEELLEKTSGRIKETAAAAGMTTRNLHNLLIKYGLDKSDFK